MRTLELLKSFSDKELKLLEQEVLLHKRKTLFPLFKELKRYRLQPALPDRAELFKKTFGKAYSKDKDYLLRNEQRLLNELIYNYLLGTTFNDHLNKYPGAYSQWLVSSFFSRKLNAFFEADIDKGIAQSVTDQTPEETALMLARKSLWMMRTQPRTIENLQQQLLVIRQWKKEEEQRLLLKIREAEAREAFVEMMLDSIQNKLSQKTDDSRTPGQTIFDLASFETSGWKAGYLLLKKHSCQTKGLLRISILNRMLKIEEAPYFKSEDSFNAQATTLTNLALEYILLDKFEEADRFMQECITRCVNKKEDIPIGNLQNYIAIQVVLGRFRKGTETYYNFQYKIVHSRSAANIAILACFCHLFLKQPEQALILLPQEGKLTPDNRVISRLIYSIVFFMRGHYNLAINECNNLKRAAALNTVEQKNNIYTPLLLWITRYYTAFTKTDQLKRKEINELAKMLKANLDIIAPHLKKEFVLLWLITEILGETSVRNRQGVISIKSR